MVNLTLENISRVLDYRTGETIEDWLARTGLTPNHMRAALNELKLFVRQPLPYEPDASGHVPTHEELTAAWTESATSVARPWWQTPEPEPRPDDDDTKEPSAPAGSGRRRAQWWELPGPAPRQRPAGEVPWWEKSVQTPRQQSDGEVPWWEKGRAAAAQRRQVLDDGPPWWESSRAPGTARGRRLTPAEIERALDEIYRRTDLTAWGTLRDYCERHRITREEMIRIFRLDEPDCRYVFEADRCVPEMTERHDRFMSESWPTGCRWPGVERDDMITSIRSVVDVVESCQTIEPNRDCRTLDRGYERER